jgi:phosphoribosyl-ATP pyrophosphohydrolase
LTREAADLVYHLLVLLESKRVPLADILAELDVPHAVEERSPVG